MTALAWAPGNPGCFDWAGPALFQIVSQRTDPLYLTLSELFPSKTQVTCHFLYQSSASAHIHRVLPVGPREAFSTGNVFTSLSDAVPSDSLLTLPLPCPGAWLVPDTYLVVVLVSLLW